MYPEDFVIAESNKHIHWDQLYPFVQSHSDRLFVLIHFSMRYEDDEIIEFFEKEKKEKGIENIKVWAGQTDS